MAPLPQKVRQDWKEGATNGPKEFMRDRCYSSLLGRKQFGGHDEASDIDSLEIRKAMWNFKLVYSREEEEEEEEEEERGGGGGGGGGTGTTRIAFDTDS